MLNSIRILVSVAFCAVLGLFLSCTKSTSSSPEPQVTHNFKMSFRENGVVKTFDSCVANVGEHDGVHYTYVSAKFDTIDDFRAMYLYMIDTASIEKGFAGTNDVTNYSHVSVEYIHGKRYYNARISLDGLTISPNEVRITENTSTEITGSFSGKLYSDVVNDSVENIITEGKFTAIVVRE